MIKGEIVQSSGSKGFTELYGIFWKTIFACFFSCIYFSISIWKFVYELYLVIMLMTFVAVKLSAYE